MPRQTLDSPSPAVSDLLSACRAFAAQTGAWRECGDYLLSDYFRQPLSEHGGRNVFELMEEAVTKPG